MSEAPFPPLVRARRLIAEWLASGTADGPDAYDDDAAELMYCLADEGLTVVTCDPHDAYWSVRNTNGTES
jgi:hypothetical protein